MAWFAFDIAAYESDTAHLSTVEHGAYFLLIKYYMRTRMPLFDDDRALANIVQMPLAEWTQIAGTIRKFFKKRGARLHQLKCDRTLDSEDMRATTRSEQARKAAEKRHSKTKLLVAASMPPARPVSAPALKTDADAMLNDATRPVQTSSVKEPETKVSGSAPDQPDEVSHGKRKRRKPQFPIPADWRLGERDRAFAIDHGFDDAWCERNHEKFLANHTARGTLTTDPSANWRTWVLNGREFEPRGRPGKTESREQRVADSRAALVAAALAASHLDDSAADVGSAAGGEHRAPEDHGFDDADTAESHRGPDQSLAGILRGEDQRTELANLLPGAGAVSGMGDRGCAADVLSDQRIFPPGRVDPEGDTGALSRIEPLAALDRNGADGGEMGGVSDLETMPDIPAFLRRQAN